MNQEVNPQNPQDIPSEDPVSNGQKILEIEDKITSALSTMQELIGVIIENKLSLDQLKKMEKKKLMEMSQINEN